jgi:hypothetical protein
VAVRMVMLRYRCQHDVFVIYAFWSGHFVDKGSHRV